MRLSEINRATDRAAQVGKTTSIIATRTESSSQMQEMKDRIEVLEQLVNSFSRSSSVPATTSGVSQARIHDMLTMPSAEMGVPPTTSPVTAHSHEWCFTSSTEGIPLPSTQPVDGMGTVLLENEEVLTFFGKSVLAYT